MKDGQGLNSEEVSSTPGAKAKKKQSSEESSSRNVKDKKTETTKSKSVKKSTAKVAKTSTDSKLEKLDQKWSERFSRLEAMLLSKTFTQTKPVFQPVVVSPDKLKHTVLWTSLSPSLSLNRPTDRPPLSNRPTHRPLFSSSLLISLSLITGLVRSTTDQPTAHSSSAACSPA